MIEAAGLKFLPFGKEQQEVIRAMLCRSFARTVPGFVGYPDRWDSREQSGKRGAPMSCMSRRKGTMPVDPRPARLELRFNFSALLILAIVGESAG
ncbi:MAG: hypothetical protein ACR2Q4_21100 [Geminicoccaceae bacterium]